MDDVQVIADYTAHQNPKYMSIAKLGITQDQIMHAMQSRLAVKRQSLNKWRNRYSKREYPTRMAANLIGADIMNIRLAKKAPELFRQGQNKPVGLNEALNVSANESRSMHREVAVRVDKRLKGQITSLEPDFHERAYKTLLSAAKAGSGGDNEQIEEIEYNWVSSALTTDLVEFWCAFGLAGLNKSKAFKEAFYFAQSDPNLSSAKGIRDSVHGLSVAILSAPGAYRQMPPLW